MLRQRVVGLLSCAMGLLGSTASYGWGLEGHAIVADIAEPRLTSEAAGQVRALLGLEGSRSMEQVASWADKVKGIDPDGPTHSVRLPLDNSGYDPARQCSKRQCAVGEVEEDTALLKDRCAPAPQRLDALKYVIHLVGDLHQPLHATYSFNTYIVFNGKVYGFHKFWDTILIRQMKGQPRAVANDIMAQYANVDSGGTPADWAVEGRNIARDKLYPLIRDARGKEVQLPDDYLDFALPIARQRLAQAGLRLARVLNDAFAVAAADTRSCTQRN